MILCLFMGILFLNAQTYNRTWAKVFNDPAAEAQNYNDMAVDKNGNTYSVGYEYNWAQYDITHFYFTRIDANGKPKWKRYFNNLKDSIDAAIAVAVDDQGFIYVTGKRIDTICTSCTYKTTISDIITMKYDSTGRRIWLNRYHDSAYKLAEPSDISISATGQILVTGNIRQYITEWGTYQNHLFVQRINKNGQTLMVKTIEGAIGSAGCFDNTNNIVIAGKQQDKPTVFKFKPNGDLLWSHILNLYNNYGTYYYVGCDAQNNIYVNGQTDTLSFYNNPRIVTAKYNSGGQQLWWKKEGNSTSTMPYLYGDFLVDAAGNSYVSGTLDRSSVNSKRIVSKYSSAGVQSFTNTYNTGFFGPDRPTKMVLDNTGNLFVTGVCYYNNNRHVTITVGYNSTGTKFFNDTYNLTSNLNSVTLGIGIDKDANLYVGGRSNIFIKYSPVQPLALAASDANSSAITIFPNPVKQKLNLVIESAQLTGNCSLVITDISGNRLLSRQLGKIEANKNLGIDVFSLKPGMYKAVVSNGITVISKTFIKE